VTEGLDMDAIHDNRPELALSQVDDAQVQVLLQHVDTTTPAEETDAMRAESRADRALASRLLREAKELRDELRVLNLTEMQIATYAAKGFENLQIEKLMGLSVHTIADHFKRINRKLGINSKLELAVMVAKAGLS
jgi:DNA-binding NarL/FixJ family response regulator